MHNNYYFLRHLSRSLQERLTGWKFLTCFSQNKDELVLGFSDQGKEFYINAILDPALCYLSFPASYARSRRNSVDLFKEAIGLEVIAVNQCLNERCFILVLEHKFRMLFKMHGNYSNILLFEETQLVAMFKNKLVKDKQINPDHLDRTLHQDYETFEQATCNYQPLFPTFGKVIKLYLDEQQYQQRDCLQRWQMIQNVLAELSTPEFYVTRISGATHLSMVPMGDIAEKAYDPIEACNTFQKNIGKEQYIDKEKADALKLLDKKLAQSKSYIQKTTEKLEEITNSTKNEEIANIIMAEMHRIPPMTTAIELYNFYTDAPLLVKLKKELSPQKNAENYYRKSKNQKREVEELEANLERKRVTIEELEVHKSQIEKMEDVKLLRKYLKEHQIVHAHQQQEEVLPYKKFDIDGFEVLVGKNAKSNDKLTQQYAWKEDLWLHAKDVSGSHVVVKYQSGRKFPAQVIEKAAQLAAYYSKRKTDSLCPVMYTPKKYVRKIKGTPDGAVKVEKEQVILVRPVGI